MQRREFSKFAAAGVVVSGVAAAGIRHRRTTPVPTTAPAPTPTTAPAPAPTSAPAPTPAPTPAPAPAPSTGGLGYPFGARLAAYVAGTRPTTSSTTMDAALTKQYDAWKSARIV